MITEKKGKYPFIIANSDSSDKNDTHWWSTLDIKPRTDLFFFYLFGIDGLKSFIMQDDKKVIEEIILETEQLTRTDSEITLVKIKFYLNACKNLSKKEINDLSVTARDFCYFIQPFGNKFKLRDFVNIWMVEDRIEDLDYVTCGIF